MKRYPGSLTIGATCLMAASAIIGWSAGGHPSSSTPATVGPDALVIYHYGESIPNLPAGMRLDIAMDTFPGTTEQASHECDAMGGELIASWDVHYQRYDFVCEQVDY